jgi:hypothetical protein
MTRRELKELRELTKSVLAQCEDVRVKREIIAKRQRAERGEHLRLVPPLEEADDG